MPSFTRAGSKAVAGVAVAHGERGTIQTEALTTAAGASYLLTLRNSNIGSNSNVFAHVYNGTNTQGAPIIGTTTPAEFGVVIEIINRHATQAFNGTLNIGFLNAA